MKVPLTVAYYENNRRDRGHRAEGDCGETALHILVQDLHKELSAIRLELKELKSGRGPGDHDRRSYFEKKFVDDRHDRTRGLRGGKGKGKGKFYRAGAANNNVKSAFHVATETFVPACTMPGCAGCHHTASECPELSLNLCSANDENVKSAHLAELVTVEMQNAFDDQDDEAFAEICDAYGQAESALRSTLSAGAFVPERPLALRSVVFEDSIAAAADDHVGKQPAMKPGTIDKPRVAHGDLRRGGTFDDWVSPVLNNMQPTLFNFNTATMEDEDACAEADDEDATDTADVAAAAEAG
ncbi:hypothetical protein CYMTET_2815 [Cymbomonas tetramitiformis]|uniref:Uncharacterized protein n=1 Tax=Cymbomonas tetramitiformis TaxID=36881 RepID=A0AAE0H4C4_9CHLO|nr:hypothetical protein CYMTET_2815 [Cymbomonas tetramitiformis]